MLVILLSFYHRDTSLCFLLDLFIYCTKNWIAFYLLYIILFVAAEFHFFLCGGGDCCCSSIFNVVVVEYDERQPSLFF